VVALDDEAGQSNEALHGMLGADEDQPKPPESLRQLITRSRRRLRLAPDSRECIIHLGNGHYVLHPAATLDWHAFRNLAAAGAAD
jgi:hypothetical protein